MLGGSIVVGVLGKRLRGTRVTVSGIALLGATLLASGLLPRTAFTAFVAVCAVMGLSSPLFSAPITALFQATIDPAKLGRVMALFGSLTLIATPVGLAAAGPLAERVGVAPWFAATGVILILIGAAAALWPAIDAIDRNGTGAVAEAGGGPAAPERAAVP